MNRRASDATAGRPASGYRSRRHLRSRRSSSSACRSIDRCSVIYISCAVGFSGIFQGFLQPTGCSQKAQPVTERKGVAVAGVCIHAATLNGEASPRAALAVVPNKLLLPARLNAPLPKAPRTGCPATVHVFPRGFDPSCHACWAVRARIHISIVQLMCMRRAPVAAA